MVDSGARGVRSGGRARRGRQEGGGDAEVTHQRLRGGAAPAPPADPSPETDGEEPRVPAPVSSPRRRPDGRKAGEIRPLRITPDYIRYAEGSALIEAGNTKVVCTASVEDTVPPFLRNTGRGWITAEYGMLPRSTSTRTEREATRGRIGGRTSEIQRLIGRCLRSVVDLEALGERQIRIDCDVLQADGGTRTAAITASFVALALAADRLVRAGLLRETPIRDAVAAVSVGIAGGRPVVDLSYEEDSQAEVDMNVAMTGSGRFVEVQGTAEQAPFTRTQMERMIGLAAAVMRALFAGQREALAAAGVEMPAGGRGR